MVALGVFLSTMDSSMINVALPSIMRSFGTTLPQTEWVVLIYLLTITASLLFWGRVADRTGLGIVYLTGMLIFSGGSVSCYLSATLVQLICFRFVQAMGASMMMATGPAIIKMIFPVNQLGKALGLIGVATSIGLMAGPVISGILIHNYSWREIFLVTVPVSLAGAVVCMLSMKPFSEAKKRRQRVAFDWAGLLCWTGFITMVVLLSTNHSLKLDATVMWQATSLLLFLVLLVKVEFRQGAPLFPLSLFQNRSYSIAMSCAALSFSVLFVVLILMPFSLEYVLGLSSQNVGFVMMAVPLSVFIVSPLSGYLYDRIGARFLTTGGLSISAAALFLLCFVSSESQALDVAWRLTLLGFGQALFLSPNSATVLKNVSPEHTGVSSGMLATSRNLGMLFGVSLAGLLFAVIFSKVSGGLDLKQYTPAHVDNFMFALQVTFSITAVMSVGGAVLSVMRVEQYQDIQSD